MSERTTGWRCAAWGMALVLAALLSPGAAAATPRDWAVVIGIDRYEDPGLEPLQFAVADAEAVAHRLVGLGFASERVILLRNQDATRAQILEVLGDELPQRMGPEDRLLVYWSGHGITEPVPDGERGYLVPWDAALDRPFATAIPMSMLREVAERSPARHVLFLLDACYSGLAVPGLRAHLEWSPGGGYALLEKYDRLPSRHVLTAGQAGERVLEAEGHGLFTHYLLRALDGQADTDGDGILAATELAAWMRARVTEASAMGQTPQYARWFGEGEYVLVVGPIAVASADPLSDGRYRAAAPSTARVDRSSRRGPALLVAGVGLGLAGGALYLAGSAACEALGPADCDAQLRPMMGATVGLWGGGALGIAAGAGLTFGAGRGPTATVGLAPPQAPADEGAARW